jgi:DNA-binding CsgD family transcriptional regulator
MHSFITPDQFISQLYRESAQVSLQDFPVWALELLQRVISFDGAIWATGHVSTLKFHTQASVDVSPDIFLKLKQYTDINPIFEKLLTRSGKPIDMADVINDKEFYRSRIYRKCFKPFAIERILSSIHLDDRSGIFTLLTLYRYDREHGFSKKEKETQSRLLYHLLSAASYRQLQAINEDNSPKTDNNCALCDSQGIYHAVKPNFLNILDAHLSIAQEQKFPFKIAPGDHEFSHESLHFCQQQQGDLFKISVRTKTKLDDLTKREQQVVQGICQGGTFKQIARELSLSPSTVSNHLYRIYLKLDIHSRNQLINLVNDESKSKA